MKIEITSKFLKEISPIFIVKENKNLSDHPFFNYLVPEDQRRLKLFEKEIKSEGDFVHPFFLSNRRKALIIGVKNSNLRKMALTARAVVYFAKKERISEFIIHLNDFEEIKPEVLSHQLEIANFEFVKYKEKPKKGWFFVRRVFILTQKINSELKEKIKIGQIIGQETNEARILINTPGGEMTPKTLALSALKVGRKNGIKVKILTEKEIKKLKMGGLLGVSQGSNQKPRFIIMEYFKGKKDEKPIILVGKGITFDTGGLNLKPENYMQEMHMDMSGGAVVIHTLVALARLKVKKNLVGLVPVAENMPSGSSYRPGDILKTMNGKTIEVLNTDAEGRIILADALEYAKKYQPRLVIDVATLTGASMIALGQRFNALFTPDSNLSRIFQEIGEQVFDLVWPLPLSEEYEEEIKGTFGDVANLGKSRYGGAIIGAVFLWQFIKGYPWVHLDIAPKMSAIEGDYLAKGATGYPIALLTHFILGY